MPMSMTLMMMRMSMTMMMMTEFKGPGNTQTQLYFCIQHFFIIFPGPISLAGRLGREGAFNMVATHKGPRAAYLVSAEGHFFPRGRNTSPPKLGRIFPRAVTYFSAPRSRIFSPPAGIFFDPPGPPSPKYFFIFFGGCARVLGRSTHN